MQESRNNSTHKKPTLIFAAFAAMLCATLISCHMVSGIWASYMSSGDDRGGAKVAVFKVDAQGDSTDGLHQSIKDDTSDDVTSYVVEITNESEVGVSYNVEIRFADNKGGYFNAWLNDTPSTVEGNLHKWTNVGELDIGETVTCTLQINVKNAAEFADGQVGSAAVNEYSGDFDFETFVTFKQID